MRRYKYKIHFTNMNIFRCKGTGFRRNLQIMAENKKNPL
jgi:hypothetical protein